MKNALFILAMLGSLATTITSALEPEPAPLEHRWVYLPTNLLVDKNIDEGVSLLRRAAKAGYTGVVLSRQQVHAVGPSARALFGQRPQVPAGHTRLEARVHCRRLPHRLLQRPPIPRPEPGGGTARSRCAIRSP